MFTNLFLLQYLLNQRFPGGLVLVSFLEHEGKCLRGCVGQLRFEDPVKIWHWVGLDDERNNFFL